MDSLPFLDTLPLFLFDEAPTLKGESIEIAEWKTVMENIIVELKKEPQLIEKLKSQVQRSDFYSKQKGSFLCCLLSNVTVRKMIGEYVAKCKQQMKMGTAGKKNATKAASIRLQGNSLFAKKEYGLAFKMYTRALMFAKDEDEVTPLLYANRAMTQCYLKQFENALQDIERAFKFGYGKLNMAGMLLVQKGFVLRALGRDAEVKELLDANLPTNENEPYFAQWQQLKKQSENVNRQITKRDITMSQFQDASTIRTALTTNEVFRPHERFPWLNAKVDLRYEAVKGRYYSLVSKEEMKYGEIVALSKPFVNLDPKRDSYERCHYCMVSCFEAPKYFSDDKANLSSDSVRMVTPLACPECSNVLYCSEACRTAAWTAYHRFECSQMTILSKMDSKSHLALRMLYMFGSLENNSPNELMLKGLRKGDPAVLIDQQAYASVFLNKEALGFTMEPNIEFALTVGFLLKLADMGDLLNETKTFDDGVNINVLSRNMVKASKACIFLLHHLYQVEVNESVPFHDLSTDGTVKPSPFLTVDGMTAIMEHSCEATVESSTILSESLESNVKLLYATGDIPAGTKLTLAYDIGNLDTGEQLLKRKFQIIRRYTFHCACTRCVREGRDCLDLSNGIYYPIACSLCGELMVREDEGGDGPYRCSSTDGCNFKYSVRQMKNIYERVEKMMKVTRNCSTETYRTLQPKVFQLKAAIESTAQLLYGRSIFLAQLYAHLAMVYLLIIFVPISNPDSGPFEGKITSSTHTLHRGHLTTALRYNHKALDILEGLKQGPGIKTHLAKLLDILLELLDLTVPQIFNLSKELLYDVPSIEQVQSRYEALQKVTDFDTMVASSLVDSK